MPIRAYSFFMAGAPKGIMSPSGDIIPFGAPPGVEGAVPSSSSLPAGTQIESMEENQNKEKQSKEYEKYMREAIRQARKALSLEEVPIGCVIVKEGKIIARGYNRRNTDKNTLAHAELNAIRKACKKTGDWRLEGCTMFVTLEPCQMCAGALVQSRIDEVVIACMNPKAGCAGSVMNLLAVDRFNHQVVVTRGILEEECSRMLSDFFKSLREKKKMLKPENPIYPLGK